MCQCKSSSNTTKRCERQEHILYRWAEFIYISPNLCSQMRVRPSTSCRVSEEWQLRGWSLRRSARRWTWQIPGNKWCRVLRDFCFRGRRFVQEHGAVRSLLRCTSSRRNWPTFRSGGTPHCLCLHSEDEVVERSLCPDTHFPLTCPLRLVLTRVTS